MAVLVLEGKGILPLCIIGYFENMACTACWELSPELICRYGKEGKESL
jgi:hypothetical protein